MPRSDFKSAFTLIELVVVVLLLGVIAAIAAPRVFEVSDDARANAELRSARMFMSSVQQFEAATGELPRDAGPGGFPSDLTGYFGKSMFANRSPAGGRYDWDGPPPHSNPRLKVNLAPGTDARSQAFYLRMEAIADDGSPTTGWITAAGRVISYWY